MTNAPKWGDTVWALAKSNVGISTPQYHRRNCRQPSAGFLLRDSAHHYYGGLGEAAIWLAVPVAVVLTLLSSSPND
ncbi:hypothetical protein [Shewanella frigidimarina]|uniref:hypothetical protein n=1 Tax=Shewanella frigidimarina TaxID=56812 RepID=UPI003F9EC8E7